MARAKNWCFTIHFADQDERDEWEWPGVSVDDAECGIAGRESGDDPANPTWHVQGFVQFKERKRLASVKLWLDEHTAHCEKARGTPSQAWDYCTKEDGAPLTFGARPEGPAQGKRSDLAAVWEGLAAGKTLLELCDEHPGTVIRNERGLTRMNNRRAALGVPKFRDVQVHVLWGDAGTGKTRYAVDAEDDLYIADMADNGWWDGYEGQEAVLIDDFYGQIKPSKMLRILDGYRLQLPVKGSSTFARYTRVYITSNAPPEEWWEGSSVPVRVRRAIRRRINRVTHMGVLL